jgi:hypothetical protein
MDGKQRELMSILIATPSKDGSDSSSRIPTGTEHSGFLITPVGHLRAHGIGEGTKMKFERETMTKVINVKAGGITVTVALKDSDASLPRELPRMLTKVREVIGWAGGTAVLAQAMEMVPQIAAIRGE